MKCRILRHKFALWVIAALTCASCTQDELTDNGQGTPLPEPLPLELTAGGLQAVATPAQPTTRGTFFDSDWKGVDKVRVQVNDRSEKEYKVEPSADKKTARLTPARYLELHDEEFWWKSTQEVKTVMAWTKYDLNETFTLPTTWTEEDLDKFDIIGVREKNITFANRNKSLKFEHLMAKVVINLRNTQYLHAAQNVDVKLLTMLAEGKLIYHENNDRLQVTNSQNATIAFTPYRLPVENYEDVNFGDGQPEKPFASYTVLAIPIVWRKDYLDVLSIYVDDVEYKLKGDNLQYDLSYVRGQVTTINVTVKAEGLRVTTGQTIGWDIGSTGSGSITLP